MSISPFPSSAFEVALADRVSERYDSWNDKEVQEFLVKHPHVSPLLLAAVPNVDAIFGRGTNIHLQVLVDHDSDEDSVLKALIQTPDPVEAAIEKRRRFYQEWWMNERRAATGLLRFDIDCI